MLDPTFAGASVGIPAVYDHGGTKVRPSQLKFVYDQRFSDGSICCKHCGCRGRAFGEDQRKVFCRLLDTAMSSRCFEASCSSDSTFNSRERS
jgi:hypothetical protein